MAFSSFCPVRSPERDITRRGKSRFRLSISIQEQQRTRPHFGFNFGCRFLFKKLQEKSTSFGFLVWFKNSKRKSTFFISKTANWYESHTRVSANSSTLPKDSILVKSGPSPEITTLTEPNFSRSSYSKSNRGREKEKRSNNTIGTQSFSRKKSRNQLESIRFTITDLPICINHTSFK